MIKVTEIVEEFESLRWQTDELGNRFRTPTSIIRIRNVESASLFKRFLNLVIDLFAINVIFGIYLLFLRLLSSFEFPLQYVLLLNYFSILFPFLYYSIMESFYGQTVGKIITNTHVINEYNQNPDIKTCFLRTIVRLIPFNWISFLRKEDCTFWHDRWLNTWVVTEEEKQTLQYLITEEKEL